MESLTGAVADSVTSAHVDEDVSDAVVMAVASATGADPLELDPLYDVVDPDALNRLVESAGPAGAASMEVSFTMAGCAVVVTGDGEVTVSPPETDDEASVIGRREE